MSTTAYQALASEGS